MEFYLINLFMKKLLILCSIIFLLAENVLFSNIHYFIEHNHNHETHEIYECQKCIIIENSNNYFADYSELKFLKNQTFQFIFEYFSTIEFYIQQRYLSRAPPIS